MTHRDVIVICEDALQDAVEEAVRATGDDAHMFDSVNTAKAAAADIIPDLILVQNTISPQVDLNGIRSKGHTLIFQNLTKLKEILAR